MSKIDEKAFKQAEALFYLSHVNKFRRGVEAYEAAKAVEQPVGSACAIVSPEPERVEFECWYTDNILKFSPHLKIGGSHYQCGLSAWVASARGRAGGKSDDK